MSGAKALGEAPGHTMGGATLRRVHAGGRVAVVIALAWFALGSAPGVGAAEPTTQVERRLERLTAALQQEAERLERFAALPRVGGADWAVAARTQLTVAEARIWRWRVAASEALGGLLGTTVADEVRTAPLPAAQIPALGLVADSSTEMARLRPVLADWAAYRGALGRVLGLLDGLRAASGPGAAGLLPAGRVCPVDGPHRFDHTWGEERPWGRTHQGEDLHASWGTPLVAVESGTIVQSGWHWSGGFGVYLEGYYSGDVYYYAHLAWTAPDIHPGAVVEAGDLLGWVGATGNATTPHLHLGWIPDNPGPWVDLAGLRDPYPLLVALCRGF